MAAEHLLDLGHERLAYLHALVDRPSIIERAEGFEQAIAERGLQFDRTEQLIECADLTYEAGYPQVLRALRRKRRPTALFCANDEMASGALRAAHEMGLVVPRDLSVVGFDDISMSSFTDPPLTTIGLDKEELGARAMRRLLELVEKKGEPGPRKDLVPVQLVLRQSTSRPPVV